MNAEISLRTKKNTMENTCFNSTYDELVHQYNLFHIQFIITPCRCHKAVSNSPGSSDVSTIQSNLNLNCHGGDPDYEASLWNGFSNKLQCVSLMI